MSRKQAEHLVQTRPTLNNLWRAQLKDKIIISDDIKYGTSNISNGKEHSAFVHHDTINWQSLGTPGPNKTDETSEKFQTAFDPPPHFRKIILRFSRQNCDKSAYVH